mmetsp:Transcript_39309/g.63826  ORF Transcript_39309/g.63826 Transcript_39309/m.63826 type:complete len:223 (-) Transcript_39309:870-1538(-)
MIAAKTMETVECMSPLLINRQRMPIARTIMNSCGFPFCSDLDSKRLMFVNMKLSKIPPLIKSLRFLKGTNAAISAKTAPETHTEYTTVPLALTRPKIGCSCPSRAAANITRDCGAYDTRTMVGRTTRISPANVICIAHFAPEAMKAEPKPSDWSILSYGTIPVKTSDAATYRIQIVTMVVKMAAGTSLFGRFASPVIHATSSNPTNPKNAVVAPTRMPLIPP